jgi:DNA-binding MarR family transcriptional regulator
MPRSPKKALRVLDFIKTWKEEPEHDGNSPTYEQIAENFDCAIMTVWNHVQRLERMGKIIIDADRKITLIEKKRDEDNRIVISRGEYIAPR